MSNETVRLRKKEIETPVIFSTRYQRLSCPGIITGFLSEERSIDTAVNPAQPSRVGGDTCLHILSPNGVCHPKLKSLMTHA